MIDHDFKIIDDARSNIGELRLPLRSYDNTRFKKIQGREDGIQELEDVHGKDALGRVR